jgi:hypothetical protein
MLGVALQGEDEAVEREIEDVTGTETPRSVGSAKPRYDLIHPNTVLKALRAFVEDNKQPQKYVLNHARWQRSTLRVVCLADQICLSGNKISMLICPIY